MKNTLKKVIAAALTLCLMNLLNGCDNPVPQEKTLTASHASVPVAFTLAADTKEISPLIYGQFIEHIEDCIYDGIWAEMLMDRKFYYEIGQSGLSPWSAGEGSVKSEEAVSLSGGHSAHLSGGAGISQGDIAFEQKEYSGYFWCFSESGCNVRITISAGESYISEVVTVEPNSEFVKCEYSLSCSFNSRGQGRFILETVSGEGFFDSLSLMPADNYHGMRADTLEKLRELGSPLYRWPGGNFLSGYDWLDGVGERDRRPSRRNLHYMGLESGFESEEARLTSDMIKLNTLGFYGGIEPNDFGLDEFMLFCEYLDAEPLMMVNAGLGSLRDAAAQVEYCNGGAASEYGRLRAENGHTEPYDIRCWGIGNEMFGEWQLGQVSLSEYTGRHNSFAKAMKAVDSDIVIVASGNNASYWSDGLFEGCAGEFDYISEHMYGERDETDVFTHISNMKDNVEGRIANHRGLISKYPWAADVKMALTEYAYDQVKTFSRLKDAMGVAAFLNSVINNADAVGLCCYSSTVNATQGCISTEASGAVMQGAGCVLKLYRDYMQNNQLECKMRPDKEYQLDACLSVSDDGKTLSLAVMNPSEYDIELRNDCFDKAKSITRHSLRGDYYDSYNSLGYSEMYIEDVEGLANVVAPGMSVSVFVIEL